MLRRFWSAEAGIFLGLWLTLMLVGRSTLLRDQGTFWHTVAGEQMLLSGHVIRTDTFSFTRHGSPWTAHQWLSECGMAAVHRLGGWDGLLLVTVTLLAGVYTWIASRLVRAGFHLLSLGVVLALVLMASSHQFHVRPLIFSIVLLGVTFCLLVDVEAGRKRLRQLWWFVPLAALWANLHAGVLAGIGTVGLCVAGWCLIWLLGTAASGKGDSPIRHRRDALAMMALPLASAAAVLLNPYGWGLPKAWMATLAIPLPSLIQEHAPLDLTSPLGWTVMLLGVGYVVALIGVLPRWPRVTWLLPLVWLLLACQRVRSVPLFVIAVAIGYVEVLPQSRWAAWLRRREMLLPRGEHSAHQRNWPSALLPLVLVVTAALLQIAGVSAPIVGRGWARFDPVCSPDPLLPDLLRLNRESPQDTPLFNDMGLAGFVIYHAPRLKVFIDDRCALYGSEFLLAYDRARQEDPARLDRWREQYGFRHALIGSGTPFDRYLHDSKEWRVVRRAPTAVLYRHAGNSQTSSSPDPQPADTAGTSGIRTPP